MSERSMKLARFIRRARGCHPDAKQENQDDLLDKGFGFLKIDVEREFHNQISDLNNEPGCKGTLGCEFTGNKSRVFKMAEEDKGLLIDFNPSERTAEIKGKEPIKFHYLIRVKFGSDETKWGYTGSENNGVFVSINGKLDGIVERALFAWFGVEA